LSSNATILANFLPVGTELTGDIGKLSLKNTGGFTAKLHLSYLDNDGKEQRTGAIGNDILINQTRFADPGENGIPDGFVVRVYSEVVAGTSRQGSEYFRYKKGNTKTASYTHSGTTLVGNKLTFNGVN